MKRISKRKNLYISLAVIIFFVSFIAGTIFYPAIGWIVFFLALIVGGICHLFMKSEEWSS
jgi:hypothetical protein